MKKIIFRGLFLYFVQGTQNQRDAPELKKTINDKLSGLRNKQMFQVKEEIDGINACNGILMVSRLQHKGQCLTVGKNKLVTKKNSYDMKQTSKEWYLKFYNFMKRSLGDVGLITDVQMLPKTVYLLIDHHRVDIDDISIVGS